MIRRPSLLVALSVLLGAAALVACSDETDPISDLAISEAPAIQVEETWDDLVADAGVVGSFALHEVGTDVIRVSDADRTSTPRLPASTFKVLNSLIILQTGTLDSVDEAVPWDGIVRDVPDWNRDHSLRSGIEVSAVWAYQDLARRVGEEAMADWVSRAGYGNADIGGGIDQFWLRGDLRTSALDQIAFLTSLIDGTSPFDDETVASVREILVRESGDGWRWSHKTGTALAADPVVGWLIGLTEHDGRTWTFALEVELPADPELAGQIDPLLRQRLARRLLEQAGALPPAA